MDRLMVNASDGAYHAAVVPAPSASDTFARRSLVEEIRQEQHDEVNAERRASRRRLRLRLVLGLLLLAALAVVAVVVKHVVDTRRVERAIATAEPSISVSSAARLEAAATLLESNLTIDPTHGPTLGRLALVRTHQHVRGLGDLDTTRAAIDAAKDAGRSEGPLCEGMLAALVGNFDEARRAHEAGDGHPDPLVAADAAWLQGVVALGHPYDLALEDDAVASLEAALEASDAWVPNLRVLSSLYARRGKLDAALELTERAHELAPGDVGPSVDETFLLALKAQSVEAVLEVVAELEHGGAVVGPDVSRLHLARGLAQLHQGELDEGIEALVEAWQGLSAADNDGRMHVIEGLLGSGQLERVQELRKDHPLGSQADALFDAWAALAKGESRDALSVLEAMPQELPRVAHLQALALIEEYRYEEALRWVEYARKRLPDRPDLGVAEARVQTATADLPQARATALERLEALSEKHPWTYRVWTGLAEARLRVPEPSEDQTQAALEALQRALKREVAPAEAAFLLAQHHAKRIFDEPEAAGVALEFFEQASSTAPRSPEHRAAYGAFLGQLARAREAKEVLLELVEDERLGAGPLLELARVVTTDATLRGTPVDEDVAGWLTTAGARGAAPPRLELEWARYELARRNPQALGRARLRVEALLTAQPRDVELRGLHGTILLAQGEVRACKATLREGIRRTLRAIDGRLYVVLARAELADKQKRRAASLAYKGWRKMVREPLAVGALLDTAPFVAGLWTDLGQPKAAATVGRGLTFRAPFSPRAWVLRGLIQLEGEEAGAACRSADRAIELDKKLPSAWSLRGDCLMALRERSKAAESYASAVELSEGTVAQTDYAAKLKSAKRRR